ncbi:Bifunctional protein FolC [Candidatus Providencia siddallii]|uniref:Dihydrofolate synthase/folylpolyglutamate synthase n=1 Tax=Candidatus Providencia siddallii TaxID=1715285 RepID=A0A0M6W7S3_9GAMM|nr:Bifunctional protein FolC [Candidatus Providencia siddallii]
MNNLIIPNSKSLLNDWIEYISNLHDQPIDMGIDRIKQVAFKTGLTKIADTVITVTGTNGKGTTCNTLESIFIASGFKVGVYSSPHLIRYTERIRINKNECSERDLCEAFMYIEAFREKISLTYFEYTTLAALYLFKKSLLNIVILEVGLGGRLDATNIIDSDIAVITNIDIDHTNILGLNREIIGYEKSGIFRHNCYGVIGELNVPKSVVKFAYEIGTKLFCFGRDWFYKEKNNEWFWESAKREWRNLYLPSVPLINAATALGVISCLIENNIYLENKFTNFTINQGLKASRLLGRFQLFNTNPLIILDVAHNPHAAKYLVKQMFKLKIKKENRIFAVIGMLKDKDIENTLKILSEQITDWCVATLTEYRGAKSCEISKYLNCVNEFDSVEKAWFYAYNNATKQDVIIVCGSFYTVSHVMTLFL